MHICTRTSWNIQWNLHTYAIINLQSEYTSYMSNLVHNRGTKRFIIKLWMNICKINSFHHRTIENQLSSQHFLSFCINLSKVIPHIKKNRRGPLRSSLTSRSAYVGKASPVKCSNRLGHQRSSRATGIRWLGRWSCTNFTHMYQDYNLTISYQYMWECFMWYLLYQHCLYEGFLFVLIVNAQCLF